MGVAQGIQGQIAGFAHRRVAPQKGGQSMTKFMETERNNPPGNDKEGCQRPRPLFARIEPQAHPTSQHCQQETPKDRTGPHIGAHGIALANGKAVGRI